MSIKKPSNEEEEYFAREEAEKRHKLAVETARSIEAVERERLQKLHHMKCPKCGYNLITHDWHGVQIDQCTNCHGIWFDAGEAESLVTGKDTGLFGRVFGAVMRGVGGKGATP